MTTSESPPVLISIVIVNYKVPEYLIEALRSILQADLYDKAEIIVVDNASGDNSQKLITEEFPSVRWIQLKHNIGFGKACNVGAQNARGSFILLLNPDTVIAKNTFTVAIHFMEAHPDAGLMGPKVLNPDGTLQASCKRGFPTPANSFYHFSGLSRIFPKSKHFGSYNLTYVNPDETSEVDAVSGSCMFIRSTTFHTINGFDEQFFLYGEDLDLCYRIRELGQSIWYHPETQIIHRKGKSSAKSQLRSRIAFYEAMVLFSRKHRRVHRGFFPDWSVFLGILLISSANIGLNLVRHFIEVIIDLSVINLVLWGIISLRFLPGNNPYVSMASRYMIGMHALLSISFIFMYIYNGIYVKRRYSISNALLSGLLATSLFCASIYFVKALALSRIAFALSSISITFLLVGWRELAPQAMKRFRQLRYTSDKTIIIGNSALTNQIITKIEHQHTTIISGIIWNNDPLRPGEYQGYPVLGTLDELSGILHRYHVDTLIIATHLPWYSQIIEVLSDRAVKNITIRWVPHELTLLPADELPTEIPLRDFSV